MRARPLGRTKLSIPPIVFGTSSLGNLYTPLTPDARRAICGAWFDAVPVRPLAIDTAGKYGAGLALEVVGDCLRSMAADPHDVLISNKLGWLRTPLTTAEPTFEPGIWRDLEHDARQAIGYESILECWQQGCDLLGEPYRPQLVSVHDPDEYLNAAKSQQDRSRRWQDIAAAYHALDHLRSDGGVQAVGVGIKDWQVAREIASEIQLDWVMLAACLTIYRHPSDVVEFVNQLADSGVGVINAAVFQAGFLVGGPYLDYRLASPETDAAAFGWRSRFLQLCDRHRVSPVAACMQFALSPPGVTAVAINAATRSQVSESVAALETDIPDEFWRQAKSLGIVEADYPFL